MVIHLNLSIGDSLGLWYSLLERNKSALRQSPCHVRLHWPNPRFEWILWLEGSLQRFQRASNQTFGDPWGILCLGWRILHSFGWFQCLNPKFDWILWGSLGSSAWRIPSEDVQSDPGRSLRDPFPFAGGFLTGFDANPHKRLIQFNWKEKKYYPSKEMLSIVFE